MAEPLTLRPLTLFLHALLALVLVGPTGCDRGQAPAPDPAEEIQPESADLGSPSGPLGRLVIIGGALKDENAAVYQAILDGRSGGGPVCVLPTASGVPEESMQEYVDVFDAFGGRGTARGVLLTLDDPAQADETSFAEVLRACSGFFFTGGSQSRIMDVFLPSGEATLASQAVVERFRQGAVISGSSAGAAIMSNPMIGGGSSAGALAQGIQTLDEGDGVWLTEGLGFLRDGLVDQHFLARGRWARLMVAVLGTPSDPLGFGIDENTALVVENGWAHVVGESGVVFLDARDASREAGGNGGYGLRLFLLGSDDGVALETGEVFPADGKDPIPAESALFASPDRDLFDGRALLEVLFEMATTSDDRLTFHQSGHFLEFRKEPGFRALGWDGMGIQGTPLGLFLGPFVLSAWKE